MYIEKTITYRINDSKVEEGKNYDVLKFYNPEVLEHTDRDDEFSFQRNEFRGRILDKNIYWSYASLFDDEGRNIGTTVVLLRRK